MERISPTTVFNGEHADQVDFEIAFTAVVVTVVLSTPSHNSGYALLKGLTISLSCLTLIRRMAVSNRHSDYEPVIRWTMPFIIAITIVATVHLFLQAGAFIVSTFELMYSPVVLAAPFIPLFIVGVFGFHERVFGDASLYLALLCYNTAIGAEESQFPKVDEWFLDKAGEFVDFSNSDSIPSELGWLKHRVETDTSFPILPVIVVGLLGYGIVWLAVSWIFGSSTLNLIFLVFVFFVKYPIQFWYSRFGLAKLTPDRSWVVDLLVILLGLFAANIAILPRYSGL